MTIEARAVSYLSEKLDIPVYGEEPERPEGEYVVVYRSSSYRSEGLKHATLIIYNYGKTKYEASEMADIICEVMEAWTEDDYISRSSVENCFADDATETKRHRYQTDIELIYF